MDATASSAASERDSIFKTRYPGEKYLEYFDILINNKPLYVCIIVDENQDPHIFVESDAKSSLCRVFLEKNDVQDYLNYVSLSNGIPPEMVRIWETDFNTLSKFYKQFDDKEFETRKHHISVKTTVRYDGLLMNIDTFWTAEKSLQV